MLQINNVFLPSSSPSVEKCRLLLGLGGTPGSVGHFSVRCLGGEYLLLARPPEATPVLYCTIHPWLSNRSASLWCATRHELVLVDFVLLEGWFQNFFLGVVFFFGGSGVVMFGDFFFVEKEGVHPSKINFSRIER